ncbi:MAG: OB-fold domain-containing protein [Haloarculaceae archaeon]
MSDDGPRDGGYDDFLDAVEAGEPYYLESPSGNGWLPPREFDPETGERELTEEPLPETGEVLTKTVVNVAGPSFADDAPYVVAVAQFGPVRLTGQLRVEGQKRGVGPEEVDIGQDVEIDVEHNETEGERVIVLEPV